MDKSNRNTAIALILAGVYVLLFKILGFFTLSALVIIILGIYKWRTFEDGKSSYVLIFIGALMLLGGHLPIVIAMILISLGYFIVRSRRLQHGDDYVMKHNILQSVKWDHDPWILKDISMWGMIGEIRMDFSLALTEQPETTVIMQGIIGDVDLIIPEDFAVSIEASVLFGQVKLASDRETGLVNKIYWQTPEYENSQHKVKLMISYIVGNIDVKIL